MSKTGQPKFIWKRKEISSCRFLNNLPAELDIKAGGFTYGDKICVLKKSEQFYLWSLLRSAKVTNQAFQKKYALLFAGPDQLTAIETDGRFFRFIWKGGHQKSYDIEFNFIASNPAIVHFREKMEYEKDLSITDFSPPE